MATELPAFSRQIFPIIQVVDISRLPRVAIFCAISLQMGSRQAERQLGGP
jgi:hypothetical protein